MEKKELHSMNKHRGRFLALGLMALIGFMASEARAANLVLTVYSGTGTTGTVIYTQTGGTTTVNAIVNTLNSDLASHGFGAYTFSNLGASSNNPGTSGPVGGFILTSGNMNVATSGSGAGTPITIAVTEGGFQAPSGNSGASLFDSGQANYAGTTPASTTAHSGSFSDSSSPPVAATVTLPVLTSNGTQSDTHEASGSMVLPPYVTPYTLTTISTVSLVANPNGTGGSVGINDKVSVIAAAVPEPASLVVMLTGMPLPLVVLGLLRRRRRAAA